MDDHMEEKKRGEEECIRGENREKEPWWETFNPSSNHHYFSVVLASWPTASGTVGIS